MKAAILIFALAMPMLAQTDKAPSELQTAKIQLAVKDYQIAQIQSNSAQQQLAEAQKAVVALIAATKKELGLDDSWDWDFQQQKFVKKPTVAKK